MKYLLIAFGLFCLAGAVSAQDTYYSIFSYDGPIPKVSLNARAASLQEALLPKLYTERSAYGDLRWVQDNDSTLKAFWDSSSFDILHILSELSGLEWYQGEFDIYVVRNAPSIGAGEPVIIPFGGIVENGLTAAVPTDHRLKLNLIYQLAHRMLAQAVQPEDSVYLTVASHPLMRPSPYRRDVLAMLLALSTSNAVLGIDSTDAAWNSAFWQQRFPGRQILKDYLLNKWVLTPEKPLIAWVNQEPYGSELVRATRPPRQTDADYTRPHRLFVQGLPLKGELGFSTKIDENNRLVIDNIDSYRLAYANGLREGDVIRRVDGSLVRTQKALVEKILERLANPGSTTLEILRDGERQTIAFQKIMLPYWDDPEWDFDLRDSIWNDSTPADTTQDTYDINTPR